MRVATHFRALRHLGDMEHTSHPPIDPGARIGHVHLEAADLERALGFYVGVLGFQVTQRYGPGAAFVSAGGYHHHIGLNTWESAGGHPPPQGTTGLYHVAILYPTCATLTRTASNSTGTSPSRHGRARATAASR